MPEQTLTLTCLSSAVHRGEHKGVGAKVSVVENEAAIMIASNRWAPEGSPKAIAAKPTGTKPVGRPPKQ